MINMVRLSQKGQTLLVVVFSMSLGLLVMVSLASRVINSVARTTQTNYFQKATAAAEGGAEMFLLKSNSDLASLVTLGKCPSAALSAPNFPANITDADCKSDFVESRAYLGVEEYPAPGSTESIEIKSAPGETFQVNLQGLDSGVDVIRVCWYGTGNPAYSDSYHSYYYMDGSAYKSEIGMHLCDSGGITTKIWCDVSLRPSGYTTSVSEVADANGGYSCYQFDARVGSVALRIFTFPGGGYYRISALDIDTAPVVTYMHMPRQGYRITSIGEVKSAAGVSLESRKATRKKVVVEKTLPYPAGPWYDFAVTSVTGKVKVSP